AEGQYDRVREAFLGPVVSSPRPTPTSGTGVEHLYGSDISSEDLVLIDKSNAAYSVIGPVGVLVLASLAFDGQSRLLYGTDTATSNLVTVDAISGATTIVGKTGISLPHGAAIDRADGGLYVAGQSPDVLYRVDKETGAATLVGAFDAEYISALDFDPTTG